MFVSSPGPATARNDSPVATGSTGGLSGEEPCDRTAALVTDRAHLDAVTRALDDHEFAPRGERRLAARPLERRREVAASREEERGHVRQLAAAPRLRGRR